MSASGQLGLTLRRRGPDGRVRYVRAPAIPEDEVHAAIARLLDAVLDPARTWHTTVPAGADEMRPQAAARLVRLGYRAGCPDILLWWPGGAGAGEIKTARGQLSKTRLVRTPRGRPRLRVGQEETHAMLKAAGVRVAVWRSVDDALGSLRDWGVPMRIVPAALNAERA